MATRKKSTVGSLWMLAGLAALLFGGLSLGFLSFAPDGVPEAFGQAVPAGSPSGTIANTVGVWWTGERGITETVDEIMAREQVILPYVHETEAFEPVYPDRSDLPQDPDSPAVSQWPPPAGGGLTPDQDEATPPGGKGPGAAYLPQTVGTSFLGAQISESNAVPPDSMGAVGPTQFLVCVNERIKVFSKTGTLGPLNTTTNSFFNSVRNGAGTSDPRVRFDRLSQRWFVSIITAVYPSRFLLAVSSGPTITGTSSFTFYYFQQDAVTPTGDTGALFDYPSLGIDNKAVYTGGNMFTTSSFLGSSAFVILKTSVLSGGPIVVTAFRNICTSSGAGCFAPQGVDNDDSASVQGYFIGVSGNTLGRIVLRRISNVDTTPTISANINITVPTTAAPGAVTVLGSTGALSAVDDRLMNGKMRLNRLTGERNLWTQHSIRVNSSGVGSSAGDRNAVRWYEVTHVPAGTGTTTLLQSGTLYSSASSSPDSYWMGDCNTSGQGHMAVACTVAGSARRAEIAAAGRLGTDALGTTQAATTLQTSSTNYNVQSGEQRWGDYSMTTVDPTDDMTIWTIQEYCNSTNSWGCRVNQLKAPPPATPSSCSPATVGQGDSNVDVVVTGTSTNGSGFFDPGPEFPNRLAATVSGLGVTVNSVTFTDATHFTMNVSVSGSAPTGARTVNVTNPDGQVASTSGLLTVIAYNTPPYITQQPQSQTACVGGAVTFSVTADGSQPLSYQWRMGGVDISGATGSSYDINPVALSDAGSYDCVITNAYGSVTSSAATLTVNEGPTITQQPQPQTACVGGSVTFSVSTTGSAPLSYQWRKNGSSISGATGSSYTINPVGSGDGGLYSCVVSNSCGTVTSSNAALTIGSPVNITGQPQSQSICVGGSATFTVAATGSSPLTYQWRKNGSNIGGATNSSYTINPAGAGDAGNYDCVVSNPCGSVTSNAATLTVEAGPTITTHPASQVTQVGRSVTFTVAASGSGTLTYQWRKNGSNIGGATNSSYTINPVALGDAGSYDCVVTNSCGSTTSNAATLTVWKLGDMNCDGLVNNQDIDGFVLALFDPAGYASAYPQCQVLNGDFTGDGFINNQDIDGFVAVLF